MFFMQSLQGRVMLFLLAGVRSDVKRAYRHLDDMTVLFCTVCCKSNDWSVARASFQTLLTGSFLRRRFPGSLRFLNGTCLPQKSALQKHAQTLGFQLITHGAILCTSAKPTRRIVVWQTFAVCSLCVLGGKQLYALLLVLKPFKIYSSSHSKASFRKLRGGFPIF